MNKKLLLIRGYMLFSALLVVVGVLGLPGPAFAAAPGISAIVPIQVLAGMPLVASKATVVRVTLASGTGTVKLTFDNKQYTASGGPTVDFYVDAPAAGAAGTKRTITISADAGGGAKSVKADVYTLKNNGTKLFFVPVDWTPSDQKSFSFPQKYDQFVQDSGDFLKGTYPWPSQNVEIDHTDTIHMLTAQERTIVDSNGGERYQAMIAMYAGIALAGRRLKPDADVVIGILPPQWFAKNMKSPGTVGMELHAVRATVVDQVDSDYATASHELGHVYGRPDDYDFTKNPPKIGNPIDADGFWVEKKQPRSLTHRPAYLSFMAGGSEGTDFWVDTRTYKAIFDLLVQGAKSAEITEQ